jgi:hypothetical protein
MRNTTLEARLAELAARVERQEAELKALKAERTVGRSAPASNQKGTRRDLFKIAGAGVVGAAATAVLGAEPVALAVDGGTVTLGQSNSESHTTTIDATGATGDVTGLIVKASGASPAVRGNAGASGPGLWGQGAGGASGPGVYGQTVGDGDGVSGLGTGSGSGVVGVGGATANTTGVTGTGGATSGTGVSGQGTGAGPGVSGTGGPTNGAGLAGGGQGTGSGVVGSGGFGGNSSGVEGHGHGSGTGVNGFGGATDGPGVSGQGSGNGYGVMALGSGLGSGVYASSLGTGQGVTAFGGTNADAVVGHGDGTGSGLVGFGGSGGGRGVSATGGGAEAGVFGVGGGTSGVGVAGLGGGPNGVGLSAAGSGTGAGVISTGGANGANGLQATGGAPASTSNPAGHGVVGIGVASGGSGADGIGVKGIGGPLAPGVSGNGSYGGQFNGTLAPVLLMGHISPGPPSSNFHVAGEIYVDGNGAFWLCTANGTPGTWGRVGNVVQKFGAQANTGGVMNLLPTPIRILDTRSGSPFGGGTTHALQVTGTLDLNGSGFAVPANAVAVIGNVTAVFPQGAGDLRLFPHGSGLPTTSNLNYNLNVTIANSAIVGLDASGQMDIYVDVNTTHVLFDCSGFVI